MGSYSTVHIQWRWSPNDSVHTELYTFPPTLIIVKEVVWGNMSNSKKRRFLWQYFFYLPWFIYLWPPPSSGKKTVKKWPADKATLTLSNKIQSPRYFKFIKSWQSFLCQPIRRCVTKNAVVDGSKLRKNRGILFSTLSEATAPMSGFICAKKHISFHPSVLAFQLFLEIYFFCKFFFKVCNTWSFNVCIVIYLCAGKRGECVGHAEPHPPQTRLSLSSSQIRKCRLSLFLLPQC